MSSKRYFIAALAFVAFHVALVWWMTALPCQDLPQHLAYSRIFADYHSSDLRFEEFYLLPDRFEPYALPYLVIGSLAAHTSVAFAIRVVMSVYVVAMFASMHVLVGAVQRSETSSLRDAQWPALLASVCVWSPSVVMGLLQFFLCIPILLAGIAGAVGWIGAHPRRFDRALAIAAALILPSVHILASGCYVVLLGLLFASSRDFRRNARLAWPVAMSLASLVAWSELGDLGIGRGLHLDVIGATRGTLALDFVTALFKLKWSDPPIIANQVLWTVLGPYRGVSLVALACLLVVAVRAIRSSVKPPATRTPLHFTARAFAVACLLAPWGMYVPTELTFINLRLMSVAFALLVATIDPRWFETERARRVLIGTLAIAAIHFGVRAAQFDHEASGASALLARVEDNKVLMSLPFHGKSDYFAKQFRLTHFLPTYYLAHRGGIATQFWAKYTDHLPIDYKPGKRPAHTPDWKPETFDVDHLKSSDYVLFESATEEDTPEALEKSRTVKQTLEGRADNVECSGRFCLYRVRHTSVRTTDALTDAR